ncbi:hypothetical protein ANANG_G00042380 [Anguilla anguilla]|uniref:U1-type domain-containing protein n=1 Tax=Anguilla anguilla TaxID=7936 RepID=A0A9D3MVE9_ANGAN|nr:hypothetical protein ANANG_G00042380 [Anguilla anguilla]
MTFLGDYGGWVMQLNLSVWAYMWFSAPKKACPNTWMKRPFSPSPLLENGQSLETEPRGNSSEGQSGVPEHRPKREKKHKTYTLCEVCNIQLNSAAQAQIHYNGKSHQKRLKQISNGKPSSSTGKTSLP